MILSGRDIAHMIDLSAVRAEDNEDTIMGLISCAKKNNVCLVTTLPTFTHLVIDKLADSPQIGVAGNVGFPSGGHSTKIKVAEAQELLGLGCTELDMVINIGKMRSGKYQAVRDEIRAVVDVAVKIPVKVIIECYYLSQIEILKACDLCIDAKAAFVKTGTGWAPSGATLENVALIKQHVGSAIAIKAAGGIRGLETLVEMYRLGATRFGIGLRHAESILGQCASLPRGCIEL